jgi:hypothetical protein
METNIIVTLAILMHGKVINLDVAPNEYNNVRLISKAGAFQDTATTHMRERYILPELYELLRKNLNDTTYNLFLNYSLKNRPEYQKFIESEPLLDPKKVFRLFENITIDKSFSKSLFSSGGIINEILCYIESILEFQGIFLVSIHQNDILIYPREEELTQNIDLLDINNLNMLANFFNKELPDLNSISSESPNYIPFHQKEEQILKDDSIIEEIKQKKIEKIRNNCYNLLNRWKLTKIGNKIDSIRMSVLVNIIKTIIGPNCFINLLDYSCNSISKYVPKRQRLHMQYFEPLDIESGIQYMNLGGKTKKRKRRRRKNKSKRRS